MPRYSFDLQVPPVGNPDNAPTNLLTCSFLADNLATAKRIAEAIQAGYPIPQNEPLPLRVMVRTDVSQIFD